MKQKILDNITFIVLCVWLSLILVCFISSIVMMLTLNRCNISKEALYTLSSFEPLRPGAIVNNTLLRINDKAFNFSISCPFYEKNPYISLKNGYIIPVDKKSTIISHDGDIVTIHYSFNDLDEGDYSLHFTGGSKQCIFNTTDKIDSHIPYREKDIFPITNLTIYNRHKYHSPLFIQEPSFLLFASLNPFVLKIESDNGKTISSYNIDGVKPSHSLLEYYFANVIYSGNVKSNISLTVTGKKIIYWVNNDGLFYKDTLFYHKKCDYYIYKPFILFYIPITCVCLILNIVLYILGKYIEKMEKKNEKENEKENETGGSRENLEINNNSSSP